MKNRIAGPGQLRVAFALFALLGLVAGACGDKKSSDTTVAAATETTAAPSVDVTETTAAVTETTAAVTETTAATIAFNTVTGGKLTVCSDIPYAPFEFERDGKFVGIDIDIVSAVALKLGLEASFVDTDFDAIFAALAAKKCDLIASSVSITDERKQSNDFSQGYFTIQQSILTSSGNASTLTDLAPLSGKTVGVQSSTTGAEFAKTGAKDNGYTVKEFTGADEMITALKAGQVDAVIQDSPINGYAATSSGGSLAVSRIFEGKGEQYGYVIPKDNPGLTTAINGALDAMRTDGSYDAILNTYLGG